MFKRIIQDLSGEKLFLFAFCIYLTMETLTTTTFSIPWRMIEFGRTAALILIVWKIISFDCLEFRTLLGIVLLFANALAVKIFAGYWEPLRWVLLLVGAHDVSFHKILKSYLVISLSILLYAFGGSLLGIIVNLQYDAGLRGVRNSFGIIYPTDFAAHVFFLLLVFLYLKRDKVKSDMYLFVLVIAGLIFYFCSARLDSLCICLLTVGHIWLKLKHPGKKKKDPLFSYALYSMPVLMSIMWFLTIWFAQRGAFLSELDRFLSSRLYMQEKGLAEYGIRLFGQYIKMAGNGGSIILPEEYFFIDCSYFYILLQYGVFFLIAVFAVHIMICKKYKQDSYFALVMILLSVNSLISHHLLEVAYNPFALALLARTAYSEEITDTNMGVQSCITQK